MGRYDRGSVLLSLGAALGLVLAAGGLLASGRSPAGSLPDDVAARVNGVPIRADDYRRALAAVEHDRRGGPDAELRAHVLDRLIEEELLVQRGLELGLAQVDPRVRRELAAAVGTAAVAAADPREPTRAELVELHRAAPGVFARGGRLHVRQVWVAAASPDAGVRARDAARRLRAGDDVAAVRAALGDPEPAPLPDAPLPVAKLADYLGPTPLRTAMALAPGAVSDPVRSTDGYHVLVLVARDAESVPPLDEIENEVRAEWRRREGERALRAELAGLRARATVEMAAAR